MAFVHFVLGQDLVKNTVFLCWAFYYSFNRKYSNSMNGMKKPRKSVRKRKIRYKEDWLDPCSTLFWFFFSKFWSFLPFLLYFLIYYLIVCWGISRFFLCVKVKTCFDCGCGSDDNVNQIILQRKKLYVSFQSKIFREMFLDLFL